MRPVLVGNPDVTARIQTDLPPSRLTGWHGRCSNFPFGQSGLASRIRWLLHWPINFCVVRHRHLDKSRIAMVGDSLHTDILGGLAFGRALFW